MLCFLEIKAQQPDLVFFSPDLTPFLLEINGKVQTKWAKTDYPLQNVLPGLLSLKITFPHPSSPTTKSTTFEVLPGIKQEIAIANRVDSWLKVIHITRDTLYATHVKPAHKIALPILFLLTAEPIVSTKQSIAALAANAPPKPMPFSIPKETNEYFGKIGCSPKNFTQESYLMLLEEIDNPDLLDIERVQLILSQLKGYCISARQLGFILLFLEHDLNRFEMLKFVLANQQIYDLYNVAPLLFSVAEPELRSTLRTKLTELIEVSE